MLTSACWNHFRKYKIVLTSYVIFQQLNGTGIWNPYAQNIRIHLFWSQYNGCWWPVDARSQGMSNHAISQSDPEVFWFHYQKILLSKSHQIPSLGMEGWGISHKVTLKWMHREIIPTGLSGLRFHAPLHIFPPPPGPAGSPSHTTGGEGARWWHLM